MDYSNVALKILKQMNNDDDSLSLEISDDIRELLKGNNLPKTLFKYATLNKNMIIALQNGQVFGNQPINFNDPLDSYFFINNVNSKIKNKLRVTCFSANNPQDEDSYLMWSHYADNHRGICLEYDFNDILKLMMLDGFNCTSNNHEFKFNFTSDNHEFLVLPCFYHEAKSNSIIKSKKLKGLFYKHKVWSYEKEFRLIFKKIGSTESVSLKPKMIYTGCKMPETDKTFVCNFCSKIDIEVNDLVKPTNFGYSKS